MGGFIKKDEHPAEYELFNNDKRVVDDFGFDQLEKKQTSSKISIRNNDIKNIKCWTNEVPAIVEEGKVVTDPRGSVFQLIRSSPDKDPLAINKDGTYKGNVVADMQVMVAKAIMDGIINWASSGTEKYEPKYRCNGDSMHHVSKGMTIIRVDDAVGFEIEKNVITDIENLSPKPFTPCFDFHSAQNEENKRTNVRQGGIIRGISVAASTGSMKESKKKSKKSSKKSKKESKISDSSIAKNVISNFRSEFADVLVGIDIQGKSDSIDVEKNEVNLKDEVEDNLVSLRTRSYNTDVIDVKKNTFAQKTQVVDFDEDFKLTGGCPIQKKKWEYGTAPGGSCPFSQM